MFLFVLLASFHSTLLQNVWGAFRSRARALTPQQLDLGSSSRRQRHGSLSLRLLVHQLSRLTGLKGR